MAALPGMRGSRSLRTPNGRTEKSQSHYICWEHELIPDTEIAQLHVVSVKNELELTRNIYHFVRDKEIAGWNPVCSTNFKTAFGRFF